MFYTNLPVVRYGEANFGMLRNRQNGSGGICYCSNRWNKRLFKRTFSFHVGSAVSVGSSFPAQSACHPHSSPVQRQQEASCPCAGLQTIKHVICKIK